MINPVDDVGRVASHLGEVKGVEQLETVVDVLRSLVRKSDLVSLPIGASNVEGHSISDPPIQGCGRTGINAQYSQSFSSDLPPIVFPVGKCVGISVWRLARARYVKGNSPHVTEGTKAQR